MTAAFGRPVIVAAVVLTACGGSTDAGSTSEVAITEAWARATPAGGTTGAAYFAVETGAADVLRGVSVDPHVAGAAELHATTTANGTATMEELDAVEIAADEALRFEPGANHVMLIDLVAPLVAGQTFELTLQLDGAGQHTVAVEVRDEAP